MNYLLFICSDGIPTREKAATMQAEVPRWVEEMDGRGVRRLGQALQPSSEAVTVRVRDGQTLVSDGPFAESKEFVAGFDAIECADLDEAIEVAAKHPVSWFHSIEVRPFASLPVDPSGPPQVSAEPDRIPDGDALGAPGPGRERYLLLMCLDGIPASDEVEETVRREALSWRDETMRRGIQIYGHPLGHAETATTVRVRQGETVISDGPFLETKEFIGGFSILDTANRQEAVEWAAKHPLARFHMIEVRPIAASA
jgi:hypothetical protein